MLTHASLQRTPASFTHPRNMKMLYMMLLMTRKVRKVEQLSLNGKSNIGSKGRIYGTTTEQHENYWHDVFNEKMYEKSEILRCYGNTIINYWIKMRNLCDLPMIYLDRWLCVTGTTTEQRCFLSTGTKALLRKHRSCFLSWIVSLQSFLLKGYSKTRWRKFNIFSEVFFFFRSLRFSHIPLTSPLQRNIKQITLQSL